MAVLDFRVHTGDSLSVRRFHVREAVSEPFAVTIVARSPDPSLDLDAIVGRPASFHLVAADGRERRWQGVIRRAEQEQAEPVGLSTYRFLLVPTLWLMSQRLDHRIFQHQSAPQIAKGLLDLWRIEHVLSLDAGAHPRLPFKVQYGETDYAFFCRILEEAGIAFTFPEGEAGHGRLTLGDRLEKGSPRAEPLYYYGNPAEAAERDFVTEVRLADRSRPGAYTLRDHDLRRPQYRLFGEATKAPAPEDKHEQYHYRPGASLIETTPSGDTPVADDEGAARHDDAAGKARAQRSLESERADKRLVAYRTNVLDLWPGRIFSVNEHPHPDLHAGQRLLAIEQIILGTNDEEWKIHGQAVIADGPYHPPLRTPRPRARLQSATVVGDEGQEIHTDEFGRVEVRFHWDRSMGSSCWLRVSQQWAGAGYGMMALPRVGQEVLVDFQGGDPEQPVIVGRVFNQTNPVVERLPQNATKSAWKSNTSPVSDGFNEVLFEDAKGKELFYAQAERDERRLVKNDETSTVVRDRKKVVTINEVETTNRNRVQETKRDRVELTYGDKTVETDGTARELVKRDDIQRIETEQIVWVGKDRHVITAGVRRELVEQDGHLTIEKSRQEKVGGTDSLAVHERYDESVGSYSVDASGPEGWIHLMAGSSIVIESAAKVSIVAGSNFVDAGPGGVTIVGTFVTINEGGSPADLSGVAARIPEKPKVAEVEEPPPPREPTPNDPKVAYELVVVDEWESPIAGLDFSVTTNAGTTTETTDRDGKIHVEGPPASASAFVRRPEDLGGLLAGNEKKERRTKPLPEGKPWHVRTPTDVADTVLLPQGEPQKMMIVTRTDFAHYAAGSRWKDHTLTEGGSCVQTDKKPVSIQMQSDATASEAVVVAKATKPGGATGTEKSTAAEAVDQRASGEGEWMRTVVDSLHDALFKERFDVVFSILEQIPLDPPRQPEPALPEPEEERAAHRAALAQLAAGGLVDPPFTEDPNQP